MSVAVWLSSSCVRHCPGTPAGRRRRFEIAAALNEQFSFQVCLRSESDEPVNVVARAEVPRGWTARVRRVGYVPVPHFNTQIVREPSELDGIGHVPGYVPDPLLDAETCLLPPKETHAFWVTVRPGRAAVPGPHRVPVAVTPEGRRPVTAEVTAQLYDLRLRKRRGFTITHWFYADAILDWYGLRPFERRFWLLCETYMRNYAAHGCDMIYVPVFTPPLDGVKRPTQLLRVSRKSGGRYSFGWRDVKRWVDAAKRAGISRFEWTHPFTQWGCRHAIRVYEGQGLDETLIWPPETGATSATYREFLSQYLPQLHRFLQREGILAKSAFHVSDEPHTDDDRDHYAAARAMLKELAPWMKVMDALTDIEYGRRKLTDMPVPSIRTALDFVAEGIPSWCYYCCGPRGRFLNRLIDTPLPKIAMHGMLFYRWPFKGFLHWGYNYWYRCGTRELVDPYHVQDAHNWPGWAYGDPFVVYPGPHGPIDSLRWEVYAESLQDYRLLQTLGVDRDDPLLRPLRSFSDFPKTIAWRRRVRHDLLSRAASRTG